MVGYVLSSGVLEHSLGGIRSLPRRDLLELVIHLGLVAQAVLRVDRVYEVLLLVKASVGEVRGLLKLLN